MNRKACIAVLSAIIFVTLFCGTASAIDMEYYTYNGFDPVVSAFQRVALIFGDTEYQSVYFVVMTCGTLFGMFLMVMKFASNGRVSIATWGMPMLLGLVIFTAMIVPKGRLFIYDEVKNRNVVVAGVPDGVVLVAGLLNRIERSFVDMIYTAGNPDDYQSQAGGVGFDMLLNLGNKRVMLDDKNMQATARNYIEDCVLFEVQRPGSAIQVNDLANNTDFMTVFANAQNPAVFTSYYDATGEHSGSCTQVWAILQPYTGVAGTFTNSIKTRCSEAGFDPTVPAELSQCQTVLEGTITWLEGATYGAADIHRQVLMAQLLNDTLLTASPDTAISVLASRNTGSSLVGSGIMANQWLPVIRGVITAVAIGLVPFMAIFIPTPLAGKALGICCGLFIWLTAWGVTDAIVHSLAMEMGRKAVYELTANQLGLTAIMNFSTGGMKAVAAFGAVRSAGIMLATVITGMLVKFGGTAMAHLAGSLTATATTQGQNAGMTAMTPEGMSRELNALESSVPVMANASKYSFSARTTAATAQKYGATQTQLNMVDSFGADGAAGVYSNAGMGRNVGFGAKGEAMRGMGYPNAYDTSVFAASAGLYESGNLQQMYGNDAAALANRKTAAEAAFINQVEIRGMRPDQLAYGFSTMDTAEKADFIDKYSRSQGVSFSEGSSRLGEILAGQKFVGAESFHNARDIVGEQGLINTRTNEYINEAAKFEMMYQLAHSLGMAENRQDFLGMYSEHKMHHGEDTLTLTGQAAVDRLNDRMQAQGYNTTFLAGDRIRMDFDDQGGIRSAYATRGANRDFKDIANETRGYYSQYLNFHERRTGSLSDSYNLTRVQSGFRGEHGFIDTTSNYKRTIGIERTQVGRNKDGSPRYDSVVRDAYFDKNTNAIAAETWTNQRTGQFTGVQWVRTGKQDASGKEILEPQFGSGTAQMSKNGMWVINDYKTVSTQEVVRGNGKFDSVMKVDGSGRVVSEKASGGQDIGFYNKYVVDYNSEFKGTLGNTFAADDKTQVTDAQAGGMIFTSMVEKGADMASQTMSLKGAFTGSAPPKPSDPSFKQKDYEEYFRKMSDVKNQKMAHTAGNYSTRPPAAAQPKITIRPKTVQQKYPD